MPTREEMMSTMDSAADQAEVDLDKLSEESVRVVAQWWAKWYLTAGHKRLGRIMVSRGG